MPEEEQAVQVVLGFAALAPTYCQSTAARACWMAAPDPCLLAPVNRHRLPCLSGLAQLQQQEPQQGQQRVSQDGVGSSEGTALVATAAARGGGEAADGSSRPHSTAGNHRLQHGRDGSSSSSTLG